MSSGPKDKKPAGLPPEEDESLLTSDDLFGDLVDASARNAAPPRPPGSARKAPVKVKVGEPGSRKKSPLATSARGEALPEDVAALLDAFSEPGEAATREAEVAAAGTPQLAPVDVPEPVPTEAAEDLLLDALAPEPAPAPDALEAAHDEAKADAEGLDDLLGLGRPPAPAPRPAAPAPSPAPAPAAKPAQKAPARTPTRRAPEISPLEALEALRPTARTGTKFQAAAPKKTAAPEAGGLDLGALAEAAFAAAAPRPAAAAAAPRTGDTDPGRPAATNADYGPYRLMERIAVGGMAEVFRAKRTGVEGFEKVLAVKRILGHLSDNKEFVDMFIDEAKVVAGLAHPNIVQIFDLGKIEKSYYIAMEYVHGRDLRTILRRARERGIRLPMDLSAFVASQVAAALEYAHRKKDDRGRPMMIVHRDVSPQNILISFEGEVKLADFGIAKAATKATITDRGALRGKLLYMSPEQAWGKPMDRRSDVFSLGICLYEMVTEQKPFLGTSERSILETVRECRVVPPTTLNARIPPTLERVMMKALEKDPDVRYQDAGDMHRDLDRVLRERQPPTARDLAKMMEVLFDEAERGDVPQEWVEHQTASPLEVDLGSGPGIALEDHKEKTAPSTRPGGSDDPMNIQKLLKRFGLK